MSPKRLLGQSDVMLSPNIQRRLEKAKQAGTDVLCVRCECPIKVEEFRDRFALSWFGENGMCQTCQDWVLEGVPDPTKPYPGVG